MDQIKIGAFIAQSRKKCGLTQVQLAERLGISDRAVSKWETGKSMPDSAIMLPLCSILKITVNDLLNGEVVTMCNYNEKSDELLLEMVKQKEHSDKQLLALEIVIGVLSMILLLGFCFVAAFVQMEDWLRICLILAGLIPTLIGIGFALRIEQTAGYYACRKCGHKHVPSYSSVLWAMHVGRTRYMRCPECGQRSWQKKVLSKD